MIVGSKLTITQVEKRHAGMLQCLATNPVGAVFGAAMLQVSPKQVTAQNNNGEPLPEQVDPEFEGKSNDLYYNYMNRKKCCTKDIL